MHPNAGSFEHVFVVGAFVHILEASPPADIVDKQRGEICPPVLYIRHQLIQAFTTCNIQSASSKVRVFTNDLHLVGGSILADHLKLVLRGVLLMLGGHAHVLRCSLRKRRIRKCSSRILHWFANKFCGIENPPRCVAPGETSIDSIDLVAKRGAFHDNSGQIL